LPIFIAADNGYFAAQHLDVQITKYAGSSLTQLPLLARGDLDLTPVVMGPGAFNQATQGFGIKLLASIDQSEKGWHDTGCILVRQDVWATGAIKTIADLKGRTVDGGVDGTAQNYLLKQAVQKGGLTLAQLNYSEKYRSTPDAIAALRNKAVEVLPQAEPVCTQMQVQGYAHKWLTFQDATPGIQGAFIATSPAFIHDHRDVVKRFLVALLRAEREIRPANGQWTPQLIAAVAKWSEIAPSTIQQIPGPPYSGQYGKIDVDSILTQEAFWIAEGSVKQRVSAADLIDPSVLIEATRDAGVR
jgi:ABC-type nitrate/sulfonate/bicarbonate transport system substrate-binding protein